MSAEPIVVEQSFAVPLDVVWRAITQPDLMRSWYFEPMVDFRPELGFETEFDIEAGGRIFRHHWKVTEVVLGESLSYDWRYPDYTGQAKTEWGLSKIDGGTKLTLICTGIEPFPQVIPELTPESCRAGWRYFIQRRLPAFLNRV